MKLVFLKWEVKLMNYFKNDVSKNKVLMGKSFGINPYITFVILEVKTLTVRKLPINAHDAEKSLREAFAFVSFALGNFIQIQDCI